MDRWTDADDMYSDFDQIADVYCPVEGEIELIVEPDGTDIISQSPPQSVDTLALPTDRPLPMSAQEQEAVYVEISQSLRNTLACFSEDDAVKELNKKREAAAGKSGVPIKKESLHSPENKSEHKLRKGGSRNVAMNSLAQLNTVSATSEPNRWAPVPVVEKQFRLDKDEFPPLG